MEEVPVVARHLDKDGQHERITRGISFKSAVVLAATPNHSSCQGYFFSESCQKERESVWLLEKTTGKKNGSRSLHELPPCAGHEFAHELCLGAWGGEK